MPQSRHARGLAEPQRWTACRLTHLATRLATDVPIECTQTHHNADSRLPVPVVTDFGFAIEQALPPGTRTLVELCVPFPTLFFEASRSRYDTVEREKVKTSNWTSYAEVRKSASPDCLASGNLEFELGGMAEFMPRA